MRARVLLLASLALWRTAGETVCWLGTNESSCDDGTTQLDVLLAPPAQTRVSTSSPTSFQLVLNTAAHTLCGGGVEDLEVAGSVLVCPESAGACTPFTPSAREVSLNVSSSGLSAPSVEGLVLAEFAALISAEEGEWLAIAQVAVGVCDGGSPITLTIASTPTSLTVLPAVNELTKDKSTKTLVFALTVIVELVLFVILIITISYRKHDVMTWSQVNFLMLMVVCGMVAVGSVLLLEDLTTPKCSAIGWLIFLPLTFMLSCLFGRVWRVHSISLAASKFQRKAISDKQVFVVAAALTMPLLVLVAVRAANHPVKAERVFPDNEVDYVLSCRSEYNTLYDGGTLAYFGLMLLLGVVVAHRSSKLVAKLNEGKYIGFALHNAAILVLIVIAPAFTLEGEPDAEYFLQAIGTMLVVCVLVFSLILPKFAIIRHHIKQGGGSTRRNAAAQKKGNNAIAVDVAPGDYEVIDGHVPDAIERGVVRVWETLGAIRERNVGMTVMTEEQLQMAKEKVGELNTLLQNATFVHRRRSVKEGAVGGPLAAMLQVHRGPLHVLSFKKREHDDAMQSKSLRGPLDSHSSGQPSPHNGGVVDEMDMGYANDEECVV